MADTTLISHFRSIAEQAFAGHKHLQIVNPPLQIKHKLSLHFGGVYGITMHIVDTETTPVIEFLEAEHGKEATCQLPSSDIENFLNRLSTFPLEHWEKVQPTELVEEIKGLAHV